jgi:hypothetical protein
LSPCLHPWATAPAPPARREEAMTAQAIDWEKLADAREVLIAAEYLDEAINWVAGLSPEGGRPPPRWRPVDRRSG